MHRYTGHFIMFSVITNIYNKKTKGPNLMELFAGHFIMFSVITNIYNKKTKGPNLMELFTGTGKLKTFFLTTRDFRCVHHG